MPESTAKPHILMCSPEFFGVEYVINPWMQGQIGCVDRDRARAQWDGLHAILSEFAQVECVDALEGLPDMCFAANGGLVLGNVFVPSVFRVPQRAPEVPQFTKWFAEAGYEIAWLPEGHDFEGEGDTLWWPGEGGEPLLWAGYGVRTALESHAGLAELLEVEVVSLRLVDERFYHLDTCFLPLPGGRVVYFPDAFDARSRDEIESRVPPEKRLQIAEADAISFSCNAIRVGQRLVLNAASPALRSGLEEWGFEVITTPMDEFMKAGGAAKCLTLLLEQEVASDFPERRRTASTIRNATIEIHGQLLDRGIMNTVLDLITIDGGSFRIETFRAGDRREQGSYARIDVAAPDQGHLDDVLARLAPYGVESIATPDELILVEATQDGVAPDDFYTTTIYPTQVRVHGQWCTVEGQRMDAAIVVDDSRDPAQASCRLIRDIRRGDKIVCGVEGLRVRAPDVRRTEQQFAFMSAGVSSERRVEGLIEELALEMKRIRARAGRIVVVAGPVVVHTGGGPHLEALIREGYVQALLTGNALPVHDIETNLYGTSLGVDLTHGVGVVGGHQHHLRAINRVRAAGSIQAAVEQGLITGGVLYECVKQQVPYVLAGSIRDDGPLPETEMDLYAAQEAYSAQIEGADMILMLASMLHSIGTGNMTPAGVRLVCVDINPSFVTKLADRGSIESTGVVTDVGPFLRLLSDLLLGPEPRR